MLQLGEEEDDATSQLAELPQANLKPEPVDTPEDLVGSGQSARSAAFQEVDCLAHTFFSLLLSLSGILCYALKACNAACDIYLHSDQ